MPQSSIIELTPVEAYAVGRGSLSPARLEEHLHDTAKRFKKLGIQPGDCVASILPEGPDAVTASAALAFQQAIYWPLPSQAPCGQYHAMLLEAAPKLLLMHPGDHPVREAARSLAIPIANVLRHFEAGVFTLELALTQPRPSEPPPSWKTRNQNIPLVLIAPGLAYRRLANRLDAYYPVIGITPPTLEHLPPPHTIEHVAAECVRMLRRYRPHGPYALAGWRIEGLVALEMARLLEEEGDKVAFVAMLDASDLFFAAENSFIGRIRRAISLAPGILGRRHTPSCEFMAEALRQYRPHPWYGKILHIHQSGESSSAGSHPWFEWRNIAPHGLSSYEAPGQMLNDPNVQTISEILASELAQVPGIKI